MAENLESFEDAADDSVRTAMDDVKGAVTNLAGEVKGKIGTGTDRIRGEVGGKAQKAGTYAKDRYGDAREGIRHGYERARKDMDQLTGDVNQYVRDNPGRSVLVAAGLGFVVGILLRGGDRR